MISLRTYNEREIKKLEKLANKILKKENYFSNFSDDDLKKKSLSLKQKVNLNANLDSILIEAFSLAREATFRILKKRQYKVQIMGGIAIHQGRMVEMKTGEGKTITEICPAYLNSLLGKGVHIITVNDYLAKRDMDEMSSVFEFLGLTVGLVKENSSWEERIEAYWCDITYTTNTEIGFDYLRDHISISKERIVQRNLNFAILDEADSILIDEARTPLIISEEEDEYLNRYVGATCC
ncbi:MAG: DEAD/DEAH box helicase [Sarcina sp.]